MPKKKKNIKLISWNVNGLRAVIKKDFFASFHQMDADIFSIQETPHSVFPDLIRKVALSNWILMILFFLTSTSPMGR